MLLNIPDYSLILLFGASGAGKTTFAQQHFRPTEILSSDHFRAMVCDDENNQAVTATAFEALHKVLEARLTNRRLTVIDATNLTPKSRSPLLALAKRYHCPVLAMVLDLPLKTLLKRRKQRTDRTVPAAAVQSQHRLMHKNQGRLKGEGVKEVHHLKGPEQIAALRFERIDYWAESKADKGPFDLIGDIHGCYDELVLLLHKLGYEIRQQDSAPCAVHSQGRKLIFLGDLVDRGPKTPQVIRLVLATVNAGLGYCAPGNHDIKLCRKLKGNDVTIRHGLQESLDQLEAEPQAFKQQIVTFFEEQPSHHIFDGGSLVAVHAGIKASFINRRSKRIWAFALYGDTTDELDEAGFPIRRNWATSYTGKAMIVYGHTPVPQPVWENNTINLDTGCVFGHSLTALRYPERLLVSVAAQAQYYQPGPSFGSK